jgi:cytochrome b
MQRLRIYHLFLAMLVLAAYFTGDDDRVHAWLGYGVAAVIAVRMLMALAGAPQLGLMRFYPQFAGLKLGTALTHPAISRSLLLGIAVCTIGAVGTGIWMDSGHTLGIGGAASERGRAESSQVLSVVQVDDDKEGERHGAERSEQEGAGEEALEEAHELLANLLLALVAAHVTYLVLFKRPLAQFMLFLPKAKRR